MRQYNETCGAPLTLHGFQVPASSSLAALWNEQLQQLLSVRECVSMRKIWMAGETTALGCEVRTFTSLLHNPEPWAVLQPRCHESSRGPLCRRLAGWWKEDHGGWRLPDGFNRGNVEHVGAMLSLCSPCWVLWSVEPMSSWAYPPLSWEYFYHALGAFRSPFWASFVPCLQVLGCLAKMCLLQMQETLEKLSFPTTLTS